MSNFREFRQQNRVKLASKKEPFIDIGGTGNRGDKNSLKSLLKQARKSGSLNLANRNLSEIPNEVYTINVADRISENSISFDKADDGWWDDIFLTKLVVTANNIRCINNDIIKLNKIVHLDLSDNKITALPDEICELEELKLLFLGKNDIKSLPENIGNLRYLQHLSCEYNKFTTFPESLESLSELENFDASNNSIEKFPSQISKLSSLRRLNLSHNQITKMPYSLDRVVNLRTLDLSHNRVDFFSEEFSPSVTSLNMQVNRLTQFPITRPNPNMQDLMLSHNQIGQLTPANLSMIPNLLTLSLANNKVSELPELINQLTSRLTSLDVSNNELITLPSSLGRMDSLTGLAIDGNAFRAIKRTVVMGSTDAIKQYLCNREVATDKAASGDALSTSASAVIVTTSGLGARLDQTELRRTGIVRLDAAGLDNDLPEDLVKLLKTLPSVRAMILSRNKLSRVPESVFEFATTLVELDLSSNALTDIPDKIATLTSLRDLDLNHNKLESLPGCVRQMGSLSRLSISHNRVGSSLLDLLTGLTSLRILQLSHCGLTTVPDPVKLRQMTLLDTLDLSNNEIGQVPPELGLCEQIRSLNLEGNSFKVPRPNVMSRGTAHILEYLRSRIVVD